MKFKQKAFSSAVKNAMFEQMVAKNERISLRQFAKEIDISASTLHRIEKGNIPDIITFFKLCNWMKIDTKVFIEN